MAEHSRKRHTHCTGTLLLWYKATFSLFLWCFCSLKWFSCYCFDWQRTGGEREGWKRRWSRDREEVVLVCRGAVASMQPACVFVKASRRRGGRWCGWLNSLPLLHLVEQRRNRTPKCYSRGAHDLTFPLKAGCYPRVEALSTWTGSFVLSWLRMITTFWERPQAKFYSCFSHPAPRMLQLSVKTTAGGSLLCNDRLWDSSTLRLPSVLSGLIIVTN